MKCREFVDFLMEYLEGGLRERERQVFEGHIEDCPSCMHYLDTYRETVRLEGLCGGGDEVPEEVPEPLVRAILAARREGRRS